MKRIRFWYLLIAEIAKKYTFALMGGLIIGIVGSIGIARLWPAATALWFHDAIRTGIVGEFTPTTLPISIQEYISQGLTKISDDGSSLPALAATWHVSDDGKTYIFALRPDAVWHTNKPVKAIDVNYNIKNVTFTPLDDNTLKATLNEPFSPFLTLVSKPIFARGLKGFGHYTVQNIRLNGTNVVYVRLLPVNDPNAPTLEYRFYRTEAAALLGFQVGDINRIEDLSDIGNLKGWNSVVITKEIKDDRIVALYFNIHEPFLSEKSNRQALAYAIPEIPYERVFSPISSQSWAFSETVRKYTFDAKRVKDLLGDDPPQLTITTFSQYLDTANRIAESWNTLGVRTTVKVENTVPSDYQVLLSAQDLPPDPDQYPFWHSTQTQTNITGYVNVKIDKLLEDGRREVDKEKRKIIYSDFQRFLTEDAPAVFLYHPTTYTITRK